MIDAKSPFTYHHSDRVAEYAAAIGRAFGFTEVATLRLRRAGLLPAAALSPSARILSVADQLDALSAERPYRGKLPREKVVAIMNAERGTGLDGDAVDAAVRILPD